MSRKTSSGLPASQLELTFHRPGRSENRSRRWAGTVSDESKLLGIFHFAQRNHHGVPFYCVVLGEKKAHAIGQHVDDARAAPLAAAKNIPKLIAFDFSHGILRPHGSRQRALPRWVQIAL
jgi:hypothetical protein